MNLSLVLDTSGSMAGAKLQNLKQAVRWVIEHPLPLYLCVVDKSAARLSVYHTFPRFYAWTYGQSPDRIEMTPEPPTPGGSGECTQWEGSYSFSLGQPILDFTLSQMMVNPAQVASAAETET